MDCGIGTVGAKDFSPLQWHNIIPFYHHIPPPLFRSPSQTIGAIIRGFKSSTTKQINHIRGTPDVPIWQRNFYEHIIRNDEKLNRIREYIITNPKHWINDLLFTRGSEL
jgi:hypothetical protein